VTCTDNTRNAYAGGFDYALCAGALVLLTYGRPKLSMDGPSRKVDVESNQH